MGRLPSLQQWKLTKGLWNATVLFSTLLPRIAQSAEAIESESDKSHGAPGAVGGGCGGGGQELAGAAPTDGNLPPGTHLGGGKGNDW